MDTVETIGELRNAFDGLVQEAKALPVPITDEDKDAYASLIKRIMELAKRIDEFRKIRD